MQTIHLLLQDEELHEVSVDENGAISDVLNNNEFQVDSQTVLSKPIGSFDCKHFRRCYIH